MNDEISDIYRIKPVEIPQRVYDDANDENNSGKGKLYAIPSEVESWSWGAFLWNFIWAVGNRVWIAFLPLPVLLVISLLNAVLHFKNPALTTASAFIFIGWVVVMPILLGMRGRKWAWQSRRWQGLVHFNKVQRLWSLSALIIVLPCLLVSLGAIAIGLKASVERDNQLTHAIAVAELASDKVADYVRAHDAIPASLQQVGIDSALPKQSGRIDFNPVSAEITVSLTAFEGKSFTLAPSFIYSGDIVWRCLAGQISAKQMPPRCRHDVAEDVTVFPARVHGLAAVHYADSVAQTVLRYVEKHGTFPKTLGQTGITATSPSEVATTFIEPNGTLTFVLNVAPIKGSFLMVPMLDNNRNMNWQCLANTIEHRFMPAKCRYIANKNYRPPEPPPLN